MIIQRHLEGNSLSLSTWSVMEPQGTTESEDEAQDDKGQSSRTLPPSPQTSNYPTVRMPSSTAEMGGLFWINWADLNLGPQEILAWERSWDSRLEIGALKRNLHTECWGPSLLPLVQLQEGWCTELHSLGKGLKREGNILPDFDTGGCQSENARCNHSTIKLTCQKKLLPHKELLTNILVTCF